jgi:polar amino acid transport system substrate-binding protein
MRKTIAIACMLMLAIALMSGIAGAANPVLKVATDAAFPPFEYQDEKTGAFLGFDMDLINAIGKKMGMDVQIINTAWDGIIPGLLTGNYNCIISAMTITDERKQVVNFSDPYFNAGQVIVTMKSNTTIKTTDDLVGKAVSVQIGTTGDLAASDIKGVTVKRFNLAPDAIQELRNGGVVACIIDLAVAEEVTAEYTDIKFSAPFTEELYGIAIAKKDTDLLKKVNSALADLKASGEYDAIFKKWFAGK